MYFELEYTYKFNGSGEVVSGVACGNASNEEKAKEIIAKRFADGMEQRGILATFMGSVVVTSFKSMLGVMELDSQIAIDGMRHYAIFRN